MKLSHLFFVIATGMVVFNGCKKPESVNCDTATICVRNTSPDQVVVYGWNTSPNDTLFPGECATDTFENIHVEYGANGDIVSESVQYTSFETFGATYLYKIDQCEIEVEAPGGFVDLTALCDNGLFDPDAGELDVDCGGFCQPCGPPNLPCTLQQDFINWSMLGIPDEGLSSANTTQYSDRLEVRFVLNSGFEITASFGVGKMPKQTTRYDIGVAEDEALITYIANSGLWQADGDQFVYLVKEANDQWSLKFCDLKFTETNLNISATASANLSIDK